ncbi:hypothetical protein F0562_017409 [Nyssa sinensis]|uniref:Uncharacterized protein n=1 Tax=Nyssa sinensis TaxID=561372 RepID=A0A5J4ZHK5_9ASTE|nr:hypothetical protein F0562_017409 [Nyssa sinensis]
MWIRTLTFLDVTISNRTKGLDWMRPSPSNIVITRQDHMWMGHIRHSDIGYRLEGGDQVEVLVTIDDELTKVRKCGVQLVYEQDANSSQSDDGLMIQHSFPTSQNVCFELEDMKRNDDESSGKLGHTKTKRVRFEDEGTPSSGLSIEDGSNLKRLKMSLADGNYLHEFEKTPLGSDGSLKKGKGKVTLLVLQRDARRKINIARREYQLTYK